MKICIYGAGAVGSLLGCELSRTGHEVTLIGRGAHMAAIRANGLTVIFNGVPRNAHPACALAPADAGPHEVVIMAVKGHQVPEAARRIGPLLDRRTTVVAAQNGIPWWYFHGMGDRWQRRVLAAVDPERAAWNAIGPERVIGAVIDASCALISPGVVDHHQERRSLTLGEPDGSASPRLMAVAGAFAAIDIAAPVTADIRHAIWAKLLSNLGVSMLCVLTRATVGRINADDGCFAVATALMREMQQVAAALGVDIAPAVEKRLASRSPALQHKPSTLQDLEGGRPMEIDPICGAVVEMARLAGVATPTIDAVYALARRLAESTGTYPANPAFRPG